MRTELAQVMMDMETRFIKGGNNMPKYKIHFTDNYGTATIECSEENYNECYQNIRADPMCDDIWVEKYNEEEGYYEA